MVFTCIRCGHVVPEVAVFCSGCGWEFADRNGPADLEPGWHPSPATFWKERRWTGEAWTHERDRAPDFAARGLMSSVVVFEEGVFIGRFNATKVLQSDESIGRLVDDPWVDVERFDRIDEIKFRLPTPISQGRLGIVGSTTRRGATDITRNGVMFDKRHIDAMTAAHEVMVERWSRATSKATTRPSPTGDGQAPAGWLADPEGRHELRYFDGRVWTDHIVDGTVHGYDPVGAFLSSG